MQTPSEIFKKESEEALHYERLELIPNFATLLPTYREKGFTDGHLEVFDQVLDSFLHLLEVWAGIKTEIKEGKKYDTHYLTTAELDAEKIKYAGLCVLLLRQITDVKGETDNFLKTLDKINDSHDPQATIRSAFSHLKKLTTKKATVKEVFKKHLCDDGHEACAKTLPKNLVKLLLIKFSQSLAQKK